MRCGRCRSTLRCASCRSWATQSRRTATTVPWCLTWCHRLRTWTASSSRPTQCAQRRLRLLSNLTSARSRLGLCRRYATPRRRRRPGLRRTVAGSKGTRRVRRWATTPPPHHGARGPPAAMTAAVLRRLVHPHGMPPLNTSHKSGGHRPQTSTTAWSTTTHSRSTGRHDSGPVRGGRRLQHQPLQLHHVLRSRHGGRTRCAVPNRCPRRRHAVLPEAAAVPVAASAHHHGAVPWKAHAMPGLRRRLRFSKEGCLLWRRVRRRQ